METAIGGLAARAMVLLGWVGLLTAGCRPQDDAATGQDSQGQLVESIATAFSVGDCATVESLAKGFVTESEFRYRAVTTMVGRCRYDASDFQAAAKVLEAVAHHFDRNDSYAKDAAYYYGKALYRLGQWDAAAAQLGLFARRYVTDTLSDDAHFFAGRSLEQLGRYEQASEAFMAVLQSATATPSRLAGATFHLGEVFRLEATGGQGAEVPELLAEAALFYERVVSEYGTSSYADDAACALGIMAFEAQDYAGAALSLQPFEVDYPTSLLRPKARYYWARSLEEAGEPTTALALLRGFAALYPTSSYLDNATYRIGRILFDLADAASPLEADSLYAESIASLVVFLEQYPTSSLRPDGLYFLGMGHYRLGHYSEAQPFLEQVLDYPFSTWFDNTLYYDGMAFYHLGAAQGKPAYDQAIARFDRLLNECLESDYRDNAAYFRARSMMEALAWADAEAALVAFVQMFPTSPYLDNAWYQLVVGRLTAADCVGAQQALQGLLAVVPASTYVAKATAMVQSQCPGGG